MPNIKVLVNVDFRDKYTNELYKAGSEIVITKERATEITNFNKNFITLIGEVEAKAETKPKKTKSKVQEEFEALVK
jgi:hypothetical protein